ncbi:MAG: hypothetical protein ACP5SH_07185 [Syntrophobacteraceae bacterium]
MRKVSKAVVLFFFVVSAVMVSTAQAALEFSAKLVVQPQSGNPLEGRIFVKGVWVRQVIFGPHGIQIMIFRPDRKVTWMITNGGKACLQMPYLPSDNRFEPWTAQESTRARFLGDETVCGMDCRKYQVVENGQTTLYWISRRLSFPVKVESPYETAECTNVIQGKLNDSLFEIPPGCGKTLTRIAPPEE